MNESALAQLKAEEDRLWDAAFASKTFDDIKRAKDFSAGVERFRQMRLRIDRARSAMREAIRISTEGGDVAVQTFYFETPSGFLARIPINVIGDSLMKAIEQELAAAVKDYEDAH